MEKGNLFIKWCWKNGTATSKKIKLDYNLTPHKINSKPIKALHVRLQYATGDHWRNNSRKNEGMEPK